MAQEQALNGAKPRSITVVDLDEPMPGRELFKLSNIHLTDLREQCSDHSFIYPLDYGICYQL